MKRASTLLLCLLLTTAVYGEGRAGDQARPGPLPTRDYPAAFPDLDAAVLDVDAAVAIRGLDVDLGGAHLLVVDAVAIPVAIDGVRAHEMVLLGDARFRMAPEDPVDAGQLALFTGSRSLDVAVDSAVLVLGREEAARQILDRPERASLDASMAERGTRRFAAWRGSSERRFLDVGSASLAIAVDDAAHHGYAAAWIETADGATLTYRHDPGEYHPVLLGRFVPWDLDDQDAYVVDRTLDRKQKWGEQAWFRLVDLGQWDTWVEGPRPTPSGPRNGSSSFEPIHMRIEAGVRNEDPDFEARAEIECLAEESGRRVLPFDLTMELDVVEVTDPEGAPLPWRRDGHRTLVLLPEPTVAGESVHLVVRYGGDLLREARPGTFALRSTLSWTPRIGTIGRSRYDLRFNWPSGKDLVSSGVTVESGKEDGRKYRHAVVDLPVLGVSFEMGEFDRHETTLGPTRIVVLLPKTGSRIVPAENVVTAVKLALAHLQLWFGPYPLEELTVTFVPRNASQGALGFVTLAELLLREPVGGVVLQVGGGSKRIRQGAEDRLYGTIAHELAHQWWGNRVGWRSGRDQWLSEALAEFAEVRFLRDGLEVDTRELTRRAAWIDRAADRATGSDRPVHAYGPPVLGSRLQSSLTDDAYRAVVYDKGSTVFAMVADQIGEEAFVRMLGALAEAVDHRTIDTPTFFRAMERMSGKEFDPIVESFVYDVNFPTVVYSHRVQGAEDGSWLVRGTIEQFPSHHRGVRVVALEDGGWDVVHDAHVHGDPEGVSMEVPFQAVFEDPGGASRVVDGVGGRIPARPGTTPFAVRLDREPTGFWLDQRGRTFASYLCSVCETEQAAIARIDALIALGRAPEALARIEHALASDSGGTAKRDKSFERSPYAIALHIRRAGLLLDDGNAKEAERELEVAERAFRKRAPGIVQMGGRFSARWTQLVEQEGGPFSDPRQKRELLALRARLDLRAGRVDAAWNELSRRLYLDIPQREAESPGESYTRSRMGGNTLDGDAESYALLAVSACAAGKAHACRAAVNEARRREADVDALAAAFGIDVRDASDLAEAGGGDGG